MPVSTVDTSILIDAPIEKVWQAITSPDQLIQWLVPNLPDAQMECDESGQVSIHMGPVAIDFVHIEAQQKPDSVTLRSIPDRLMATRFDLSNKGGGTQVMVTMMGFDSLREETRENRMAMGKTAWGESLANLKALVEANDLPHATAFVSPLFGYWRDSKNALSIERSIWIDATRDKVWRAISDPKHLQQWFSPTTEWHLTELEVGGRLFVLDEESQTEKYVQIIEVVDPPNELTTRQIPEPPATAVKGTSYFLTEEDNGTRMTVLFSGYEQDPAETRYADMERDTFGTGMMLQNLKAFLEGTPLPVPWGF